MKHFILLVYLAQIIWGSADILREENRVPGIRYLLLPSLNNLTDTIIKASELITIKVPTALISGVIPRRRVDQMYMGKVLSRPVRKNVTGISSKETVNDNRALPMIAVLMLGKVTRKKVW